MKTLFVVFFVLFCFGLASGLDLGKVPRKRGLPIQTIRNAGDVKVREVDEQNAKRGLASIGSLQLGHGPSYFVTITLGKINLQVALDTGSSDLWVLSTGCNSKQCKGLPAYPLSFNSPSFSSINNNQTVFNISYADGTSASGFSARENITLYNVTATNQAFALVDQMNLSFDDEISGVLGLGFSRLSRISHSSPSLNITSFIGSLAANGTLEYPLFGISLPGSNNGSLTLGAVDSSVVNDTKKIIWHPVVPFPQDNGSTDPDSEYLHWAIPLAGITANGTDIKPIPSYPGIIRDSLAMIDVGASGIYGPYQDVAKLFSTLVSDARMVKEGQWALPCDTTATMSFNFGDPALNVTLEPQDYIIGEASGSPGVCLVWPQALPPNNLGIDWQLGVVFMKKVYSVFSYGINGKEPPMIGLMPLPTPTASSTQSKPTSPSSTSSATQAIPPTITSTISTTFPNFPLPTSTSQLTSPYALNTSAGIPSIGTTPKSDMALSTYKPVLQPLNASAIPTINPPYSLVTFVKTDGAGTHTETSTSILPPPTVSLGAPPGFGAAGRVRVGEFWTPCVAILLALLLP